ncbi:MAG: Cell division protein FtsA [Ignavibacteriae bacterium]|nr:MAG: Cell division protein FtsA [Ignavibacteriota bacterium]
MNNQEIIVGLDIGTTKVCAVVAKVDEQSNLNILGVGYSHSEGLTRGVVTNIEKTVRSINNAIEEAEVRSGIKIRSVVVGIAGEHIQSFQSRGVVAISNPEKDIKKEDVDRLIEDTKKVALPMDRKIIHVIPQEFIVDGQDGIKDPIGMSGVRLEAHVHIITGLVSAAENIYKCVERAGLEVCDMVLEPLASSYAVLNEEEKEVGVALLDIGGGTTDLAVFEDSVIRHTAVIPFAGNQVTNDLRKVLGILTEQAEKLKKQYGFAYMPCVTDDSPIILPGIGGRPPIEVDKRLVAQIIQPRMEEILEVALMEIKRSGSSKHLSAGAVLTGGGSLIKGTKELAQEVLGMPVKIGFPTGFTAGLVREVESPIYSTSVGLVLYALQNRDRIYDNTNGSKKPSLKKIYHVMREWFKNM